MELIDSQSIKRAIQTFRLLPFNSNFYADVQVKGLHAESVLQKKDRYKVDGLKWFRSSNSLEASFSWMISVGILRREVDGQGLTSRVRLTPLGRQILEQNPEIPEEKANLWEEIIHWLKRRRPM